MKRIFCLLFIIGLLSNSINTEAQFFQDVDPSNWAYSYVEDLVGKGIIDINYFYYPDRELTRSELVKIVIIATTGIIDDKMPPESTFADVDEASWYYHYVETAKLLEVVEGYSDGNFRPSSNINRAEVIKVIIKAFGIPISVDPSVRFRDYSMDEWFHKYVNTAYNNGIISGKTNKLGVSMKYFSPSDPVTRAEMAKMVSLAIAVSN